MKEKCNLKVILSLYVQTGSISDTFLKCGSETDFSRNTDPNPSILGSPGPWSSRTCKSQMPGSIFAR